MFLVFFHTWLPGINFKDVTTLIKDADAFRSAIESFVQEYAEKQIDYVIGCDARGFIIGASIATANSSGFVPIRKKGKLAGETIGKNYKRLRIGIGHPGTKKLVSSYVLKKFKKDDRKIIDTIIRLITELIILIFKNESLLLTKLSLELKKDR